MNTQTDAEAFQRAEGTTQIPVLRIGGQQLLGFSTVGSAFVFGPLGDASVWSRAMVGALGSEGARYGVIFAFQVLPTIIFIAALFAILYYFGVMQLVVRAFAIVMHRVMRASGAESLNVAASIFMGQTEAPLTIRPFLAGLTQSELFTIMTSGMAHVSGAIMAASRPVRDFFDPWVSMLYSTPTLALGPLFMLALGIGMGSKIALIFLTSVFPILINTLAGLTTTDRVLLEVVRSYGATRAQLYTKVRMPAALLLLSATIGLGAVAWSWQWAQREESANREAARARNEAARSERSGNAPAAEAARRARLEQQEQSAADREQARIIREQREADREAARKLREKEKAAPQPVLSPLIAPAAPLKAP